MKHLLCIIFLICFCAAAYAGVKGEHPEPQMKRSNWLSLNGVWDFAETDDNDAVFFNDADYPDKITVPFCRESSLSGLGRKGFVNNVWYKRSFKVPSDWKSERVRLHIGACDWETRVWINDTLADTHIGGSAPIVIDITDYLNKDNNTVIIHAYDNVRSGGLQALGKQSTLLDSYSCFYTRVTGIWQTVWLEGVGSSYLKNFKLTNDIDKGKVYISPNVVTNDPDITVKAVAYAGKKLVASDETKVNWRNTMLTLDLSEKHLWSIEDPYLYELRIVVKDKNDKIIDDVYSYFGFREVTINGGAVLINRKPVFQRLVLDQGYYPDGIWTSPTDEALKNDIIISQAAGFNGARLHQKVFEPRFLYWADKLGYIVWGEYPSWGLDAGKKETHLPVINEWRELVERDFNHPSIVGWCPFNEMNDDCVPLQNAVVYLTRDIDPSRPILDTSGWVHGIKDPEVMDMHDYDQNPVTFRARWNNKLISDLPSRYNLSRDIPFFISEYGGTAWNSADGWGYGDTPKTIEEFYSRFEGLTSALMDDRYSFGLCYTQLYDLEQEQNGIYTYEREPKFDIARLNKVLTRKAEYEKNPPVLESKNETKWTTLVGSAIDAGAAKEWHYTFNNPQQGWYEADANVNNWQKDYGAFASDGFNDRYRKTIWDTEDIWLRQEFVYDGSDFDAAVIVMFYDDDTEVYINGKQVLGLERWSTVYVPFDVTSEVKGLLKRGSNVIAVHCHQSGGDQFIDLALLIGKTER